MDMPDEMKVRLHFKRLEVVEVKTDLIELLEIVVKDTRRVVRCPFCGSNATKVHETRPVEIADLPFAGQKVVLIWMRRRFECEDASPFRGSTSMCPVICGRRHTCLLYTSDAADE